MQTLRLLHTETPKSGTNTMSRQWGPGPIFCSGNSLALNSEGLEVPKDTERRGENDVNTNTTEATVLQDVCSGPDHSQSSPSALAIMPPEAHPWPQPEQEETDFRERNGVFKGHEVESNLNMALHGSLSPVWAWNPRT